MPFNAPVSFSFSRWLLRRCERSVGTDRVNLLSYKRHSCSGAIYAAALTCKSVRDNLSRKRRWRKVCSTRRKVCSFTPQYVNNTTRRTMANSCKLAQSNPSRPELAAACVKIEHRSMALVAATSGGLFCWRQLHRTSRHDLFRVASAAMAVAGAQLSPLPLLRGKRKPFYYLQDRPTDRLPD